MFTNANIADVLEAVAWPLAAILIGLLFRAGIKDVFRRLLRMKLPGGGEALFAFGSAELDKTERGGPAPASTQSRVNVEGLKLKNYGNLFWLGHDLMWTADVVLRGAPLTIVKHGLTQSLKHARALGFAGSPPGAILEKLRKEIDSTTSREWTPEYRNTIASDINRIISDVGGAAVGEQPDFHQVTE